MLAKLSARKNTPRACKRLVAAKGTRRTQAGECTDRRVVRIKHMDVSFPGGISNYAESLPTEKKKKNVRQLLQLHTDRRIRR